MNPGVVLRIMSSVSVSPTDVRMVKESVGWDETGLSTASIKEYWNWVPALSSTEFVTVITPDLA